MSREQNKKIRFLSKTTKIYIDAKKDLNFTNKSDISRHRNKTIKPSKKDNQQKIIKIDNIKKMKNSE